MSPRGIVFTASSAVWLVLMAATALSWWLGTGHSFAAGSVQQATLVVLVLAFFKVRLVIRYFMEVRHAPWPLRLITDVWVAGACAAVMALYLWA